MLTSYLLDWALRATLLLAGVLLIARAVERRSATIAHRSLVAAFVSILLLLPLGMTLVPGWWTIPFMNVADAGRVESATEVTLGEPGWAPDDEQGGRSPRNIDGISTVSPDSWLFSDDELRSMAAPETRPRGTQQTRAADLPRNTSRIGTGNSAGHNRRADWGQYLVILWTAMGGALLLRLIVVVIRLRKSVDSCSPAPAALVRKVQELSLRCGLKRPVRILLSRANTMPMACWLRRWMIVVPENLTSWPQELQETTLLHELGHIARRDAWADLLAQCVVCLLWPSPFAWIAAWETRRLRERACDEWSLQKSGLDAKQYAFSLVEVVRQCQSPACRVSSTMADKRGFESRLRWISSRSRPQSSGALIGGSLLVGIFGLAIAIATARPTESAPDGDLQNPTDDHAALASRVVLSEEPSPKHPSISVSGMVIDPNGAALEGVSVVLRANMGGVQYVSVGFPHSRDILARTTTDMRGRFSFTRIGIPPRMVGVIDNIREGKPGAQVLAWGRGYGLQWQSVQAFEEADKQFRLSEEADVSGVVVDELGHPMDDAQLVVTGFTQETENLDAFLSGPGDLNLVRSEIQFRAAVRGGRFVLANMPHDYRISVRCMDFVAGNQIVFLIDTGKGTIREARYRNAGRESVAIHRTPIRITAKRQPSIRLRIVDHQGNPVSGGGVDAIDENRRPGGSAEVDEHGVAILAVNQPGIHEVYYSGDPLNPVSGLVHSIDVPSDQGETVVMKLPASRPIAGRVVDGDTGEPVSGVYIHAGRQAEEQTTPRVTGAITVSGSDGRFQLPVTEGLYRFSIRHEVNGYLVPTLETRGGAAPDPDFPRVTVTADQIPEEVVIRIGRGLMVEGTVLNPQGMPVSGVKVLAASDGPPYRQSSVSTDSDGRFQLAGHSPYVPTRITVLSDLGAAQQTIAAATDHPWDKTLRKTVTLKIAAGTTLVGRVVRNGRPVSGVRVRLLRAGPALPGEDRVRFDPWGEAVTDDQGRYQLSGLSKGDRYYLEIEPYENAEVRDWPYQMPYSHAVGVEDGATIELPDAELISHGQTLAGVVVDPDGNPVEGITVSASLASGGRLSRPRSGPPPWVQTDGEGRFRLTYLPDEPISLMAHRANPSGGRIRYPSRVNPEMNARDIHIVFDPALLEEPEDLDSQD